jgi:hypothetical protein
LETFVFSNKAFVCLREVVVVEEACDFSNKAFVCLREVVVVKEACDFSVSLSFILK